MANRGKICRISPEMDMLIRQYQSRARKSTYVDASRELAENTITMDMPLDIAARKAAKYKIGRR